MLLLFGLFVLNVKGAEAAAWKAGEERVDGILIGSVVELGKVLKWLCKADGNVMCAWQRCSVLVYSDGKWNF